MSTPPNYPSDSSWPPVPDTPPGEPWPPDQSSAAGDSWASDQTRPVDESVTVIPIPASQDEPGLSEPKQNRMAILLVVLGAVLACLVLAIGGLVWRGVQNRNAAAAATLPPTALPPTALPPAAYATVPVPTVIPPTPAPQALVATALDYVNIRSGPGTQYPIYGVASPGASAEIVGKSADSGWWAIKISTNYAPTGMAWVSASYVAVSGTGSVVVIPAPPPPQVITPPPPPPSNSNMVYTIQPAYVYPAPVADTPPYGQVPAGTALTALGITRDGLWVGVAVPASVNPLGIGYVMAAYLAPFNPATLPPMQP
jgi:hypothetical protein